MRRSASVGLVFCIITIIIILAGCSLESVQTVSLNQATTEKQSSSERWTCLGCKTPPLENAEELEMYSHFVLPDTLRIAVSAMTMPRETLGQYEEVLRYVGDKLGKRVELVQRKTYREVNELIKAKLIDAAFICSLSYVLGRDEFGMELLVTTVSDGAPVYHSYIIARNDSGIDSLERMRGKTFAFMDPDSNSGTLYPIYRLAKMGESPFSFFSKFIYTYGHDNSIKAVLNKTVDGAAVENLIFEYMAARNPAISTQIRVLEKSPPFGSPPVVVHPALRPDIKESLRRVLLDMHDDERGKEILGKMNIEKFSIASDADYDSIREMYRTVQLSAVPK